MAWHSSCLVEFKINTMYNDVEINKRQDLTSVTCLSERGVLDFRFPGI
jgi:hypothetical protein